MHISKIFLKNYRNFEELNLDLEVAINIFFGKNAQGKTNILESIYFSTIGKSRAAKDFELVQLGKNFSHIRLEFFKQNISHTLAIEISPEKKFRRVLLDGNQIKFREIVGKLNSVMFSPEDIFMFKSSPSSRRKFLDSEISQASPIYFQNLLHYNRIVEQRNNLLKKIRDGLTSEKNLDLWTEQLSIFAAKIILQRLSAVEKLNFLANSAQQKISSQAEKLFIKYDLQGLKKFEIPTDEKILTELYRDNFAAKKFLEIKRGATLIGAHLDDLKFFIDDKELKVFGSQGQLRTAALALKISELEFLREETGEYPILLLDDVMSELDFQRREQLLNFLAEEKIQTLITATEKKYFPTDFVGKFFEVSGGKIL